MNTFTITPIEDTDSVICQDICNFPTPKKRLTKILHSGYDTIYNDPDWRYKTLRAQLEKTYSSIRKDVLPIVYSRKKEVKEMSNIERANAKDCISAGDTSNVVRAGIWGDTCYDFDMDVAHQALLMSAVTEDDKVLYPVTKEYVENKKRIRKEIADEMFGGDVDEAKTALTRLTFGSSLTKAFEYCKDVKKSYPKKAILFKNEMDMLANKIHDANLDYFKVIEKQVKRKNKQKVNAYMRKYTVSEEEAKKQCVQTNPKTSLMSEWCRNKEAVVMESVIKLCIDNGIIQDRRFDNSKDGVMIPKADVDAWAEREGCEVSDLLLMFSDNVKEQTGFTIGFSRKCMQEKHDAFWQEIATFEQPSVFPEEACKRFDRDYMQSLDTYHEKKEYFELFNAWVHEAQCFAHISSVRETTDDGREIVQKDFIYYSSVQKFTAAWGYLDSNITDKVGRNVPFVDIWTHDATRREFVKIGCTPYAGVYDPRKGSADELNAFRGYPEHIWKDPVNITDEKMFKDLQMFFKMQKHLLGEAGYNKEDGNYPPIKSFEDLKKYPQLNSWLHIIGHRISRPHEPRKPYVPIITGVQGTGKNLSLDECFARQVGEDHYRCSSDIEDFFGTHATALCGKILAVLNEASVKTSGKYKNKLKGLGTDKKAICNEKFMPQFQYDVTALIVIISNENCPVMLEMNSNRRYFMYKCNPWCAEHMSQKRWADVAAYYKNTVLQRSLRALFERLDYDTFDYAEAKRQNAQMPAYKNMIQHFFPPVLRFWKEYIELEQYNQAKFNDDTRKFCHNPQFAEEIQLNSRDIQEQLKAFLTEEHNPALEQFSSVQKFNNSIADYGLPMVKVMKGRTVQWRFSPKKIYAMLMDKMVVDRELLEPDVIEALGGIVSKIQTPEEEAKDDWMFELSEDQMWIPKKTTQSVNPIPDIDNLLW